LPCECPSHKLLSCKLQVQYVCCRFLSICQ
jgi:hypothetical protein